MCSSDLQAVSAADVKRVINQYFIKENRSVATYTRKGGKSAGDQSEPALTPEQRSALQAMASKLNQEKDSDKLKQALQALEEKSKTAGDKSKPLIEAQKQLLQHRIEELK